MEPNLENDICDLGNSQEAVRAAAILKALKNG